MVSFGTPATAGQRNASIVATMPAGAVAGNLVRLAVLNTTSAVYTAPSGWNLVASGRAYTDTSATTPDIAVYYRLFDGSSADSFTAPLSVTSMWVSQSNVVTNADMVNPISGYSVNVSNSPSTTSHTGATLTPPRSGLLDLTAGSVFSATSASYTPAPSMTQYLQFQVAAANGLLGILTTDTQTGVLAKTATGTRTATCSVSCRFVALMVVWADPPPPASANVRIGGAWATKPLAARMGGAWVS